MLAAIVAMGTNRVIGRDGTLPWRLPDELKHFKRTTMGRVVILGRRTFEEELASTPLPGRPHVIVTRDRAWACSGVHVRHDLDSAIELAHELAGPDAWSDPDRCPVILGGGQIYAESLPLIDRLYLTLVDMAPEGDTRFPDLDESAWTERSSHHHPPDDRHPAGFTVRVLDRTRD